MNSIIINTGALKLFTPHKALWACARAYKLESKLYSDFTTGFTQRKLWRFDQTIADMGDLAFQKETHLVGDRVVERGYRVSISVCQKLGVTEALVLAVLQQAQWSAARDHIPFIVHAKTFQGTGIPTRTLTRALASLQAAGLFFRAVSRRGIKIMQVVVFNEDFANVQKMLDTRPYLPTTPVFDPLPMPVSKPSNTKELTSEFRNYLITSGNGLYLSGLACDTVGVRISGFAFSWQEIAQGSYRDKLEAV